MLYMYMSTTIFLKIYITYFGWSDLKKTGFELIQDTDRLPFKTRQQTTITTLMGHTHFNIGWGAGNQRKVCRHCCFFFGGT